MTWFEPPNNIEIAGLHLEIDQLRVRLRHTFQTVSREDPQRRRLVDSILRDIWDLEKHIAILAGSHDTRKYRHPLAYNYDLQWEYR